MITDTYFMNVNSKPVYIPVKKIQTSWNAKGPRARSSLAFSQSVVVNAKPFWDIFL